MTARILIACRLVLGALFVWAAVAKLPDMAAFAQDVANYRLVPALLVPFVACAVVGVELLAGAALILGLLVRPAALVLAGLLGAGQHALPQRRGARGETVRQQAQRDARGTEQPSPQDQRHGLILTPAQKSAPSRIHCRIRLSSIEPELNLRPPGWLVPPWKGVQVPVVVGQVCKKLEVGVPGLSTLGVLWMWRNEGQWVLSAPQVLSAGVSSKTRAFPKATVWQLMHVCDISTVLQITNTLSRM